MSDRTLLVDLGNTRLKWVWARGAYLDESSFGRGRLDDFIAMEPVAADVPPGRVLLSSVANPASTANFLEACEARFGVPAKRLESSRSLAGIVNAYENPASLGVDRWLAIVGAAHTYGMPVVVMDLGTATTLDAIDGQGRHLGGLILPGPASMLKALADGTAMEVPAGLADGSGGPRNASGPGIGPARSTAAAITEGVCAAQIGALNQFLRHVAARLSVEPKLVLTGGAAGGILERLDSRVVFDPWLVFKGMLQD